MWSLPQPFGKFLVSIIDQDLILEVADGGTVKIKLPKFDTDAGEAGQYVVEGSHAFVDGLIWRGQILLDARSLKSTHLTIDLEAPARGSGLRHRFRLSSSSATSLKIPNTRVALSAYSVGRVEAIQEFQIGQFSPVTHSYVGSARTVQSHELEAGTVALVGPLIALRGEVGSWVFAHEAGVEAMQSSWGFRAERDRSGVSLMASAEVFVATRFARSEWKSPWFHAVWSSNAPEVEYQRFISDVSNFAELLGRGAMSYNTWHMQESNHYLKDASYIDGLAEVDLLAEAAACSEAGVDIFVMDVGWFHRTGDWEPNTGLLGADLLDWSKRLQDLQMTLGVWMNPIMAGETSKALARHPASVMTRDGHPLPLAEVWETEPSAQMCLISVWADHIRQTVKRLAADGVRTLKLDGLWPHDYTWEGKRILQGCDSFDHNHGDQSTPPHLRLESYRYEFGEMIVALASEAASLGVLVDLDVTESERWPSLGMVVAGRLFLVNNGPYFHELGIPSSTNIEPNTYNATFFPSVHHARIERQATGFLPWLPANRFLTHVLPADDETILSNAIGTALVGSNGIWGEMKALSPASRKTIRENLSARPNRRIWERRSGEIGGSPEIYEIVDERGEVTVVAFTFQPVCVDYMLAFEADDGSHKLNGGKYPQLSLTLAEDDCVVSLA